MIPLLSTFSNDRIGLELPSRSYKEIVPSLQEDNKSGEELTVVFKLGDPITKRSVGMTPSANASTISNYIIKIPAKLGTYHHAQCF